jgi:hypothetical protein
MDENNYPPKFRMANTIFRVSAAEVAPGSDLRGDLQDRAWLVIVLRDPTCGLRGRRGLPDGVRGEDEGLAPAPSLGDDGLHRFRSGELHIDGFDLGQQV